MHKVVEMAALHDNPDRPLTFVVVGASGDLARKKVLPALFALHCQGLLPAHFQVVGLARTAMDTRAFRERIAEHLTCRYTPDVQCADRMDEFLARCFYVSGPYESSDSFLNVYAAAREQEGPGDANRVFYMAIPPFLFMPVARAIGGAGFVQCGPSGAWSRVVIEKPFGRDRQSSDALVNEMAQVFTEEQTFRIDHYLGKEVIQNLLVLRFANQALARVWDNGSIGGVHIRWQEDIGIGSRGGYFDQYGIVRDVMQNHLLQMLALTAMEPPESLAARHVRDAKVRVLQSIAPVTYDALVLGQYEADAPNGVAHPAYRDEPSVPADSRTATFAAAVVHVAAPRWQDVPFLLSAGKGLGVRQTEIRIRFKRVTDHLFLKVLAPLPPNELVVRVQPGEAISLHILNKAPGLTMNLVETDLALHYESEFRALIPDAYESLLLDVLRGDKSLFIRADELAAAWDIFTPVLAEIDRRGEHPRRYPFGSEGPREAAVLAERFGLGS